MVSAPDMSVFRAKSTAVAADVTPETATLIAFLWPLFHLIAAVPVLRRGIALSDPRFWRVYAFYYAGVSSMVYMGIRGLRAGRSSAAQAMRFVGGLLWGCGHFLVLILPFKSTGFIASHLADCVTFMVIMSLYSFVPLVMQAGFALRTFLLSNLARNTDEFWSVSWPPALTSAILSLLGCILTVLISNISALETLLLDTVHIHPTFLAFPALPLSLATMGRCGASAYAGLQRVLRSRRGQRQEQAAAAPASDFYKKKQQ
ncbi:hypothetical protein KIPB_009051 [Kipferlia bialata]|uniref:Transmembrane protein n=1 Tax=Kipferlia bialata TaxID=797122 RepID=A0A9K3D2U2_9EUKA|nr:hypothetical protein KIPB_009051 [Kipferlia bialata]|eukprot:g9051.t1